MYVRHRSTLVEVQTPAKVNLFLEVLSRRDDGFHEIETLMVPIEVFDTLWFKPRGAGSIDLTCRWAVGVESQIASRTSPGRNAWEPLPAGPDNLVVRTLERLRQHAGISVGADVQLRKRIPAAAGLGGASSDAAAALVAANAGWGLDWSRERLATVAAEVGSDVPFFLHARPCICRGRGERIEPVGGLPRLHLVIVRPPTGLATRDVYRQCQPARQPRDLGPLLSAARRGDLAGVGRELFNRLQEPAERLSPWIARLSQAFARLDCLGHQMSGSGTSYLGVFRHARQARRAAGRLRSTGLGAVFCASTLTATAGQV